MKSSKNDKFEFHLYPGVLKSEECKELIKQSINFKAGRTTQNTTDIDTTYRKATVAIFDSEPATITKLRQIFAEKTNTDINQQETPVSVIRYEEGGSIIPHLDYFGGIEHLTHPEAGDRLLTGIAYLNDDYDGGETLFTLEDIKIKGKEGDLLVWSNLNKDRSPNRNTLHAGLPVLNGIKYIIILWARENIINKQYSKTLL